MNDIVLGDGEVICDHCQSTDDFCRHCHGIGKFDWIENIVGKKESLSPLDRVNVRMLYNHIEKQIESYAENNYIIKEFELKTNLNNMMNNLLHKSIIYDYNTTINTTKGTTDIQIVIKPHKSVEQIIINSVIKGGSF